MKNNAMFLLDLASSADVGNKVSFFRSNPVISDCLEGLTAQRRSSATMPSLSENNSPPDFSGPFNPVPPFQCLQSLGADSTHTELPFYEEMLKRQNLQDGFFAGPSGRVRISTEIIKTYVSLCATSKLIRDKLIKRGFHCKFGTHFIRCLA